MPAPTQRQAPVSSSQIRTLLGFLGCSEKARLRVLVRRDMVAPPEVGKGGGSLGRPEGRCPWLGLRGACCFWCPGAGSRGAGPAGPLPGTNAPGLESIVTSMASQAGGDGFLLCNLLNLSTLESSLVKWGAFHCSPQDPAWKGRSPPQPG